MRITHRDVEGFRAGMGDLRRGAETYSNIRHQRAMEALRDRQLKLGEKRYNLAVEQDMRQALLDNQQAEANRMNLEAAKRQNQVIDLDTRLKMLFPYSYSANREYIKRWFPHLLEPGPTLAMTQANFQKALQSLTDKQWAVLAENKVKALWPEIEKKQEELVKLKQSGNEQKLQQVQSELNQLVKTREAALTFLRALDVAPKYYDEKQNVYYKEFPDRQGGVHRVIVGPGPKQSSDKLYTLKPGEALVTSEGKTLASRPSTAATKPLSKSNFVLLHNKKEKKTKLVPYSRVTEMQNKGWEVVNDKAMSPDEAYKAMAKLIAARAKLDETGTIPAMLAAYFHDPELAKGEDDKSRQRARQLLDAAIEHYAQIVRGGGQTEEGVQEYDYVAGKGLKRVEF